MFGFCEKDEKSADQSSKMFLRVPRANRFEVPQKPRGQDSNCSGAKYILVHIRTHYGTVVDDRSISVHFVSIINY